MLVSIQSRHQVADGASANGVDSKASATHDARRRREWARWLDAVGFLSSPRAREPQPRPTCSRSTGLSALREVVSPISDIEARTSATSPRVPEAWQRHGHEVAVALGTDPSRGLRRAEARARLKRTARIGSRRGAGAGVAEVPRQFADPLIYLLLRGGRRLAGRLGAGGWRGCAVRRDRDRRDRLANAVLGYVQEARAEQAVAALQRMAAATAGVLRDGREERIPAAEVVPGDVLLLAEGDAVAADGRLLEAASLTVAEASLTGESEPVLKDVGRARRCGRARRPHEHGLQRYRGRARSRAGGRDRDGDVDGDGQGRTRCSADRASSARRSTSRSTGSGGCSVSR